MKMNVIVALLVVSMAGCKKEATKNLPLPEGIEYTDFNNQEIKANESIAADLNKDGRSDLFLYTMNVGDVLFQRDYVRYHILGSISNFFPVSENEETPILNKGDSIAGNSFSGYEWYNATQLLMAQKVIEWTPPPYWQGSWKDASHRYLPMRIQKGQDLYYGWIELSFDTTGEKIIMHKAAMNREANKAIQAGF